MPFRPPHMRQRGMVHVECVRGVVVVSINNPPVNALSKGVRYELYHTFRRFSNEVWVRGFIITSHADTRTFPAGADISEFTLEEANASVGVPQMNDVLPLIELNARPVVAALSGTAFGGGLELALACHVRIAAPSTKLGLPEVQLGIIPGAGGTQRLPRLVDLQTATKMITTGRPIPAKVALECGLVDALAPNESRDALLSTALRYVEEVHAKTAVALDGLRTCLRPPRVPDGVPAEVAAQMCVDGVAKQAPPHAGGMAARAGAEAIAAALRSGGQGLGGFQRGLEEEARLFLELVMSPQSAAKRHIFFAERAAGRLPPPRASTGEPRGIDLEPGGVRSVGVIGAGTMGSGIAVAFLAARRLQRSLTEVHLVDTSEASLGRGMKYIQRALASLVKRGRMSEAHAKAAAARLRPSTDMASALAGCDLVIEAVFEDLEVKKRIFAKLAIICKASALLCTNTSTLDVDAIAAATGRRAHNVLGMHFFSPAHLMRLVEVVRGAATSREAVASVMGVTKAIGKVGVVVGNCDGFVGNRLLKPYGAEAAFLLEEGCTPSQVDGALKAFGMAMGPFEMGDLSGNDIGYNIRRERGLLDPKTRDPAVRYCEVADRLVEAGRLGHKTGKGWYRYDKKQRGAVPDPEVDEGLLAEHRRSKGVTPRSDITAEEVRERCLLSLVNEGFRALEEGIAARPSDIDVVYIFGYGWPDFTGGPMHWADAEVTLEGVHEALLRYQARFADVPHWKPSRLLAALATAHLPLSQWREGLRLAASLEDQGRHQGGGGTTPPSSRL